MSEGRRPGEFRASQYIDFNTGTVFEGKDPMSLYWELERPFLLPGMLDLFECRVDVWQFGPAVEVLKQIEKSTISSAWFHSAYALLSIVFSYFEMIGKTLNPKRDDKSWADFNYGFCDVYPFFERTDPAVHQFRDRVRNGLYHLGYTKSDLNIHNCPSIEEAFCVTHRIGATEPEYWVNPHKVTRRVVDHFPGFMKRLRESTEMQDRFLHFFTERHASGK